MKSQVSNMDLRTIRVALGNPTAWQIADEVKKKYSVSLHESTIRGRFIEMGEPLSGQVGVGRSTYTAPETPKPEVPKTERVSMSETIKPSSPLVPAEVAMYIPTDDGFSNYIERPVDNRLAVHYALGKYPITQGKQGTGKTFAHMYYAFKYKLPFFLYSCYEDFKLRKMFGDKTIQAGTLKFKESILVRAIQGPCLILFDEINAVSNANSFDFHALLQNRELMVKDADDGNGKIYKLHPECRMGFAQNPKSAKYIGGVIKPSNFLGRCTFITFPEFTHTQIKTALTKRYPKMLPDDVEKFTKFYFSCTDVIRRSNLPVDISIRQLNNVVDLWMNGLPLEEAIEDGLSSMLEAVSQPQAKESFHNISALIWKELMKPEVKK